MRKAFVVTGLGFGDEGKGSSIDFLTREYKAHTVIRHGGAQAGHNVVLDDWTHHTFAQFGSGTFQGASTYLSEHMVVHPVGLLNEANALIRKGIPDPFQNLWVHEKALIVTPYHQILSNRREEARGAQRHGSCGIGVGEAVFHSLNAPQDALTAIDLKDSEPNLRDRLSVIRDWYVRHDPYGHAWDLPDPADVAYQYKVIGEKLHVDLGDALRDILTHDGTVIFEGSQGVLLDEWHGFHPHTTWGVLTHERPLELLQVYGDIGDTEIHRLGVLRTYMTRHGEGPFPTEDKNLSYPEMHNNDKCQQGRFRGGHFDAVLMRYALRACGGVDGLVLTHKDVIPKDGSFTFCNSYEYADGTLKPDRRSFTTCLSAHARPVGDRRQCQNWFTEGAHLYTPNLRTVPTRDIESTVSDILDATPVVIGSHGPRTSDKAWCK